MFKFLLLIGISYLLFYCSALSHTAAYLSDTHSVLLLGEDAPVIEELGYKDTDSSDCELPPYFYL